MFAMLKKDPVDRAKALACHRKVTATSFSQLVIWVLI